MKPEMETVKGYMCHYSCKQFPIIGSIPVFDEIIVSTENMKTIRKFDELRGRDIKLVCVCVCVHDVLTKFSRRLGDLVCDAGCVLQDLDAFLGRAGFQVCWKMICRIEDDCIFRHWLMDYMQIPLDLPARHACQIGGNISTNAGGIRQMRFGNLHGSVMGLEVVSVWDRHVYGSNTS